MKDAFKQLIADGYQVRPGEFEDLPQMVLLVNAAEVELTGAGDWTVERYQEEWRQGGLDLATSTRVVIAPDGSIVGCIELWDQTTACQAVDLGPRPSALERSRHWQRAAHLGAVHVAAGIGPVA